MEEWNFGMVGKKLKRYISNAENPSRTIIPILRYSSIPFVSEAN